MTNPGIEPCAKTHGFDLLHSEALEEIGGTAYVFEHKATRARLLYLANDDNNKGFSITFKTPASDDTGVFHILEHSVLCGSRKFPVKEPFVNLLKSSMQTFLNAMTFPDKTMYPVASTNERDLLNLADVYMDAVFHPNIYRNRRIFEQEGWHYELDDGAGAAGGAGVAGAGADPEAGGSAGELVYNGVVYNEMKGALSDPESVLYDTLSAALFPDTTYRFESGGTPEGIPTLTYEDFLATHARHYHPSNSYIVLYGNMDPDPFLEQIDGCLIGALEGNAAGAGDAAGATDANAAAADAASAAANAANAAAPSPNPMDVQRPVVAEGVCREMSTAPENSCAALGFVVGHASERERMIATSVLVDALMGSNEAPLKRALLDADIADDCDGFLSDSVLQPFVAITARGLHGEGAADRLRDTVAKAARELAAGALDMELVEAALSHAEFVMREGNFGYADGVVYSISAMNGWLYDDDPAAAVAYIRYEDAFAFLREQLSGNYFANLLREIFIDSDHHAQVEVKPVEADDEAAEMAKLRELQGSMSDAQLEAIAAEARALHEAQMAPDDPADLAKLPKLSRSDVGEAPSVPECSAGRLGAMELLRHEVDTHGIVYAARFFDLSRVAFDEIPYASVLALVLGKLDTAEHTAAQIDTLVQSKLGSLSFACEVFDVVTPSEAAADGAPASPAAAPADAAPAPERALSAKFSAYASALSENAEVAAELVNEILASTNFRDPDKMLDVLVQRKVAMEQRFATAGNYVATARASSYILPAAVIRESIGGIDFYVFLKRLIDDFDARFEPLAEKLAELAARLFSDDGCMLSFAGDDGAFERYAGKVGLGASGQQAEPRLVAPEPVDKREAFIVPADITYSALVADRFAVGGSPHFSGSWMVASRALSYDYLWNEVRVVGGAYGVGFSTGRPGTATFSSYRDPHVDETIERFKGSSEWLSEFDPTDDELEGYVVSTAASFDKPLKPRDLVGLQRRMRITGYSREEFLRRRQEVLDVRVQDVRGLAPAVGELCESGSVCVVGNKDIIEQSGLGLDKIDLLAL